ncbi:MAG: prepilin-type N-terminal cleavage/methylation domain-containing protein [Aquificaceae bacterium]|nr:prepilin-type N-terminal cleavage/methylation domain-containing protein [Aquificaceae bacterium]MDW8237769.1 prepilin-type N-terminal cleavage/methylation domain-containing protein [Aquificaceae bacterium]
MWCVVAPRKGGAFTLVELLVVLAIIAILASIATSQYLSYMAKARISSYALPLARTCFAEIVSYCTSEGTDGAVNISSLSNCSNTQTAGGMVIINFQTQPVCFEGVLSQGELHATIQGINTYKVICSVDVAPFKCWIE